MSYSEIFKEARDAYRTGRITPQTNCLVIRPVLYADRAIDYEINKT